MYRNELKFVINAHQKNLLANKLKYICQRDSFGDPDGGYLVTSLYFDDYNESALFDKLTGSRDRKKYRVRVYNKQPDIIKLERKIKWNNVTEKSHFQILKEEYDSLIHGDVGFLKEKDNALAEDFYLNYRTKTLRPNVVVEYRREALIYKYGEVRITFDYFLKAGLLKNDLFSNGYMISAIPHNKIILEVKYTGYFPEIIWNTVQMGNIQWQSVSKYAICCCVGK